MVRAQDNANFMICYRVLATRICINSLGKGCSTGNGTSPSRSESGAGRRTLALPLERRN